jgi:protein ImuA
LSEVSASENASLPRSPRRLRWELGCPASDGLLPRGLEPNSLHEIKGEPSAVHGASAADWMTGIGFAARLAVRRVDALAAAQRTNAQPSIAHSTAGPWVLWCWPRPLAGEFGLPSAAGFLRLGLDPSRLIIVETARASEALNAIEEGLRAQSLAAVIGVLDEAELTPARRLSLAAGETATPCLLVTHPASEPAGATATRWRVKRDPSARHPFDPRAPGAVRFSVALERCKARPESAAQPPMLLEWSDETRRFDLASVVADLPAQTRGADGSAFPAAVRAY